MTIYSVLSIDAWADGDDGWTWNQWFNAGTIDVDLAADSAAILQAMADAGYIKNPQLGDIEDDPYNLVIVNKETREPIFAIEYGSTLHA